MARATTHRNGAASATILTLAVAVVLAVIAFLYTRGPQPRLEANLSLPTAPTLPVPSPLPNPAPMPSPLPTPG